MRAWKARPSAVEAADPKGREPACGRGDRIGRSEADGTDAARRMALEGLARAFEEAESGRDWFAMKAALGRVDDAVQAVWYASRVRDDGRR